MFSHEPGLLGKFEIVCDEFMFVQYMPIQMPNSRILIPPNMDCFWPLVNAVPMAKDDYVYLTVKHLYVDAASPGNRPGWHIDGYRTDDKNYLWSDSNPTEFCVQEFYLADDHAISLRQMEVQASIQNIRSYPVGSLLALDNFVVHRISPFVNPGYRTFAKISVSKDRYNLKGNAHNYLFDYDWKMHERHESRNHTSM